MQNLGFPGPYCELVLGRALMEPQDLALCVAGVVEQASTQAVDALLGAVSDDAGLSKEALNCLRAAVDGAGKLAKTIFRTTAKCRDAVNKGKKNLNPTTCVDDDARLAVKIDKAETKFRSLLGLRCTGATVGALDFCATGSGSLNSVTVAADCLVDLAREAADGRGAPLDRSFIPVSLVESAYPPAPRCGDSLVNQKPNAFLLLGEECDGAADSACPGNCLPPGDLFECTCGDIPRLRFFAKSEGSETDAGWTGLSHDQLTADLSGFIVDLDDCNCSAFDGECAAGPPTYHCDGAKFLFKSCSASAAGAGCSSVCSGSSAPCIEQSDCPSGQTCQGSCPEARDCAAGPDAVVNTTDDLKGAGRCIENIRSCFLDPIVAQGGSTLNGQGDATNFATVGLFCQRRSINVGANSGAGLGGPTRVRVRGTIVPNFTAIP